MSASKSKILATLILETFQSGEPFAIHEIARIWGADRVLVSEWVEKFRKRGLVRLAPAPKDRRRGRGGSLVTYDFYVGDTSAIDSFLKTSTATAA